MLTAAFYVFSGLLVVFSILVIALRNPVSSALSLVMAFLCLAALFITLDAYFIGVIQVLVYAGAVMVLFLFIIMLMDMKAEEARRIKIGTIAGGLLVAGAFAYTATVAIVSSQLSKQALPSLAAPAGTDIARVGTTLFTTYNLPFQVIGALLLVATVGVVVLSKKELK
jgi:NADH-quinone oxidoreductase subunit J